MQTIKVLEDAKICFRNQKDFRCPGDSGDIKCFFCPWCVLSLDERVYNLQMYNIQVYNSRQHDPR